MWTAKTLVRLGGCPGGSESLLGAHATLLVLSWGSSNSIKTFTSLQVDPNSFLKNFWPYKNWRTKASPLGIFPSWNENCRIYSLSSFTEKPNNKPLERNAVYTSIITLCHVTSHDVRWRQNKPWFSPIWLDAGDIMMSLMLFRCL